VSPVNIHRLNGGRSRSFPLVDQADLKGPSHRVGPSNPPMSFMTAQLLAFESCRSAALADCRSRWSKRSWLQGPALPLGLALSTNDNDKKAGDQAANRKGTGRLIRETTWAWGGRVCINVNGVPSESVHLHQHLPQFRRMYRSCIIARHVKRRSAMPP
jgi:hypothetical protein